MKNTCLLTILLIAALLSACAPENPYPAPVIQPGSLQVWVDAPLESTTLTLPVAYTLVCHGSDPSGVQALEFSINEQVLAEVSNPDSSLTLFYASHPWEPVEPGTYTIRCRARNTSGEWGGYAAARVFVVEMLDGISPTPSLTQTATLTPTHTATPTVTLTATSTTITFTSQVSTNTFEYQRDCVPSPGQVTITARLSNTVGVKSVYLFFRLESADKGITTGWNPGILMAKGTDGYSSTIAWDAIPQLSQIMGSSAVFAYQFVVADFSEIVIARSQVFRDITLQPCN